ncbi:hypothetical protein [Pseudoxanthomonas mexicana]|uniref:DUF7738 domain-containing protein n=1 Tax=Pseudoxanthomonas mexicana TaxID=128785 RepID=UPI00398AE7E5
MRAITHAVILALLLPLNGCDFARSQWSQFTAGLREATTAPREIKRGAKPEIIIKGDQITFDGKPLRLRADVKEWIEVLGPNFRIYRGDLIWDEKGLIAILHPQNKSKVRTLSVELNFKQLYEEWDPEYKESGPGKKGVPKEFFKGYLEINGLPIDAQSTIHETNRRAHGELSISCSRGINICSDHARKPGTPLLYFSVDSRKEQSIIYEVQVDAGFD